LDHLRREYLDLKPCESLRRVPERFPPPYSVTNPAPNHYASRIRGVHGFRNPWTSILERGPPETVLGEARHEGYGALAGDLRAKRAFCLGAWGFDADEKTERPVAEGTLDEEWWETMGECLREGLADGVRHTDALGREVRGDGSLVEGGERGGQEE
jgi:hypothetical protein